MGGIVTRLEAYGAFVRLDEYAAIGLVHISQIAEGFVEDVHEVLTIGEAVRVRVLAVEAGRVSLSRRGADVKGWELRSCLGGDPGDAWNREGETVWARLGERSPRREMPWEADPRLFTFNAEELPGPPPRWPGDE